MDPNLFKNLWNVEENGPLINFDHKAINILKIDENNKQFFIVAGLPETPAPYLEFISSKGLLLNLPTKLSMPEQYEDYWYLGTTSSGSIICLIEGTGNILAIDVQNNNKETVINSSMIQFAEFLYRFSEMIIKAIEINGEDAFIDNNIPEELLMDTIENLKVVDEAAMKDSTFWQTEFEDLVSSY
jgi:hypothetical protein